MIVPRFGGGIALQHKNRESNVTNIGNRNEPLNISNSFSRLNKNQAPERKATHPQSLCRAIPPPKRGTIIEEPKREYNDFDRDNQSGEFVPSDVRHRALNSPRGVRKWDRLQQKLEKTKYSDEHKEGFVANHFELEGMPALEAPQVVEKEICEPFGDNFQFDSTSSNEQQVIRNERNKVIDTGTYTKKSHYGITHTDSSQEYGYINQQQLQQLQNEPPPYPLPVGYPIFASTSQMNQRGMTTIYDDDGEYFGNDDDRRRDMPYDPTLFSPLDLLPNPFEYSDTNTGEQSANMCPTSLPVRQSPASALPPFNLEYKETDNLIHQEVKSNHGDSTPLGEYIPLNPDIDKPSPPRLGKNQENGNTDKQKMFCANPFELSDEETCPVEPEKKLSPSHVFESTTLEQSLLLGDIQTLQNEDGKNNNEKKKNSLFDSNTFVIRKGSSTPKSQLSPYEGANNNIENTLDSTEQLACGQLHSPSSSTKGNTEIFSTVINEMQSIKEVVISERHSPDQTQRPCLSPPTGIK
jgi:hypothetical protein